jgi:hypothetical protein
MDVNDGMENSPIHSVQASEAVAIARAVLIFVDSACPALCLLK